MHKPTKATNSRLEGHHFLVGGHCKAVGGQDLRLEAVASRWWTIGTSATEMTSRWLQAIAFLLEAIARPLGPDS